MPSDHPSDGEKADFIAVHELIAARAAVHPDAVAVVCGKRSLTYAGLVGRSARLARYLRALGVGPESMVALCLPRGLEMVTAVVAVGQAGGAYLPLDPDYPAERLAFMLTDGGAAVLVADRAAAGGLVGAVTEALDDGKVVWLDDPAVRAELAALPTVPPESVPVEPAALAYTIYTSGSTGTPKGVQVPHAGPANLVAGLGSVLGVAPGVRMLQFASFSFDAAVLDIAATLACGGTLVVATGQERAEPSRLTAMLRAGAVRAASVVPSLLGMLSPQELPGLDTVLVGAERLTERVARAWARNRRLVNTYGPTEASVMVTTGQVDPETRHAPPIGSAVPNVCLHVLDEELRPVAAGVTGELFIGGPQLARGYGGRPALTAERFVADPFAGDGTRLYRTGDRVRWTAAGDLEFVGRTDDQVKVRGFRVELGEVEAALAAHPGVRTAVVALAGDGTRSRLAAHLLPADPGAGIPGPADLREHLRGRLPDFMIPASFTELAALPLTPAGKIDRAALPDPASDRPDLDGPYVAPATPTEDLLAEILAEILGVGPIGAFDNFFELGGHSLLAMQVISRVREVFEVELSLAVLFDQPTVRGLAAAVEGPSVRIPAPPVTPAARDQALPLSFAQQRLWFLDQLEPGSAEYNVPLRVPLAADTDVHALSAALDTVVARHEVLRTRLVAGPDGTARQVIDPPGPVPLPIADVSEAPEAVRVADRLVALDAVAPFDLAAGPLLRACLIRLGRTGYVLSLTMHHVAFDEWSGGILRRELSALTAAFRTGKPDPLPPLEVQYADFALWQRAWLTGDVLDRQLAYWRERLDGLPVVELPTDHPRPPVRSSSGRVTRFAVPGETAQGLRRVARESGASMFMVVFAAYAALLGRYCATDDIVVGTPVANRNRAETEDLIGFFVNTLVMRADLSGDPSFAELVGRVRETALGAYAHQDLPFEQLVDALVTERDRSRTPLFQAFFNYDVENPGDIGTDVIAKFDLRLIVVDDGVDLVGVVEYSTALFEAATISRLTGHLITLLGAVAGDADVRLSGLPMLTAGERAELVEGWSGAGVGALGGGGVVEAVVARAGCAPDAVAVVGPEGTVTYGALAGRVVRLASYLRGVGVGPESVVGLCLPAGVELVTAVLAVWCAGGAYLPLDPGFPAERLALMLSDSRVSVVVGTGESVGELPAGRLRVVVVDDPVVRGALAVEVPVGVSPVRAEQLAYVVFTSGSSGRPKGVQVTFGGVAAYVAGVVERVGLGGGGRFGVVQPLVTDLGNTMVFAALVSGGVLHVLDGGLAADPGAVRGFVAGWGIEFLKVVPSHLVAVGGAGGLGGVLPGRVLVLGGEAVSPVLAGGLLGVAGDRVVVNHYGPTETTVGVLTARLEAAGGVVAVGRPLPGTRVFVLDGHLNPVPVGVAGELFVGGVQVARGYGRRPALTGERFVADPFSGDGSRLYRTGDRVRWLADGRVEFLGRVDGQVKVRGFRIEPGEVEAVLAAHPGVGAAVVVADGLGVARRLVAYVVPARGGSGAPGGGELREFLARRLPEFMVPSVFVELEALPLTSNGKVDRAALPDPETSRPELGTFVAPVGVAEELLAGIWVQVLGCGRVGAGDNFFELGGHSLLATQVISRIREVFGTDIPLAALFDHPTVRALAAVIDATAQGLLAPPVGPVERDQVLPLSFGQQRLWFLDQLEPGSVEYNVPSPVWFDGPVDVAALGEALSAVVARHEVLRTRLVAGPDGVAYQVIDPPARVPLPVVDVSGVEDPMAVARGLIEADAAAPFDLAGGPLLRACLVRAGLERCVLVLCLHHAVSDEWSGRIFRRDLQALYGALLAGQPDPLPPLPVQYADFAVWQRSWLTGDVLDGQLAYWREVLAGAPVMDLPTDRPRPPVRSSEGTATHFTVPAPVADVLRDLARRSGATMYMTLLAAVGVVLGRYAGLDDVVVGSPAANRTRAETEDLIGFFVNTLVLRTDLSGDPTFAELLDRVRETALGAYAHQDLPFEQLVDALVTERDRSRTPLFQVFFNYLRDDGEGAPAEGGPDGAQASPRTVKFDLAVNLVDAGTGLSGSIEYSTALFDRETAERMVGHLLTALGAVAEDPDRRLSRLPILTTAERNLMQAAWNDTTTSVPAVEGVHELVAAQAAARPDAVAVVAGGTTLTYAALEERADRLADRLRALGSGAESVVGLCLERGLDTVVAILAVWKAGAAYLPLDPDYPAERLAFVLADSGVRVLVGHRAVAGGLSADTRIWLDDPAGAVGPAEPTAPGTAADRLAYVIYTSGSTGIPKGVQVTQHNLVNFLASMAERPGLTSTDVLLAVTTLGFDIAGLELLLPLTVGAQVAVAARDTVRSPRLLAGEIGRSGATVMQATPSTWQMLVADGWSGTARLRALCGGEALPAELARAIQARTAAVWNMYGPTETTIWSTCRPLTQDGPVALGSPVANTRVHVLDRRLSPVPAGVAGELFIGGAGVARGYAGRPALTAERFVADPFAADGSRLYRTGDVVRRRANGEIEFLGRADDQVKVRGFRVELGEVTAALTAHPRVRSAAVAAWGEAGDRLAAYLVPVDQGEGIPAPADLRAFLRRSLPEYMVPSVFTELAALPLTPNGKLDRAALPAPDTARPELGVFVAPAGATEELLAGIWAQLLGADQIGALDGFFELGGHSLLATQVISRIREVFGAEVPLAALFEHPTLRALAAVVDQAGPGSAAPPITPVSRDRALPLSFAQQRLWFLNQLEPWSDEYNLPSLIPMAGPVDVAALGAALGALVARHEVLRTRLVAGPDGVAYQMIDPPLPVPLPVADLSGVADPLGAARRLVAVDAAQPFDLAAGWPLRACLIRMARTRHVLALTIHHVAFDDWSDRILQRELSSLYEAFRAGEPDPLPPLAVQYADFAVWQRAWLAEDVQDRQLAYWRERLAALPVLQLPLDRPRPPLRSSAGAAMRFSVPGEVVRGLHEATREGGATMYMTLLAAFSVLLGRYGGQDDIVVGTPVAGRNRAESEDLIGFFVNTLVMRTDLSGDPTFAELVGRVRETALGAYAHQDLPFEQLVDALVTERDRSRTPLFQVLFDYYRQDTGGASGSAEAVQGGVTAKFDLRLVMVEDDDGLTATIEYGVALFDAATIGRLAGHLQMLLARVAEDASRPISEASALPAVEHAELLALGSGAARQASAAGGVPGLLVEQASTGGDTVAVVCGETHLTYGGLVRRAARLARHLRGLGVGPESVVGVCMNRGVDLVVAVVGVWFAGAAFVPLDPEYPSERLAWMLADSGARVVVGDRAGAAALDGDIAVVRLDDPTAWIDVDAPESAVAVVPAQLAYVIYTSGTTGVPKGVQVGHGGLVGLAVGLWPLLGREPRGLLLAPFSFDAAVWELVMVLSGGGTLVVASAGERAEPGRVGELVRSAGVELAFVVPSLLRMLVPGDLAGLRTLVTGAERVDAGLAAVWGSAGYRLLNAYGPTEATVVASIGVVGEGEGVPAIGGPVPGARLYVVDGSLNLVPAGVAGELLVGGGGVARGYGGRPALTAERFVPDPFAGGGSRVYRTGDRVRWRADGRLEFVGRVDDQVKVRGYRIEPGEVETVLAAHPGIRSAVVTVVGDGDTARLAAYLVPADPAESSPARAELREYLRSRLPAFMIPASFTELSALPLTPGGKIDRTALPDPEPGRTELSARYVAPRTRIERVVAKAWAEALGLDRVGVDDDFFQLGGHSLLVTRIVARIRSAGYDTSVGDLFDRPTVAGVAEQIEAHRAEARLRSAVRIRRGDIVPAVYAVHSITGEVAAYAGLADHLGEGQQLIALQERGLVGDDRPLRTVGKMAAGYLREVFQLQPDGPYLFAAQSGGCYVALEMARRAAATGKEVGGVFLMGPAFLGARGPGYRATAQETRRLLARLDDTIQAPPGARLSPADEDRLLRFREPDDKIAIAVREGDKHGMRIMRAVTINGLAYTAYGRSMHRTPYDGRVVLFMPGEDPDEIRQEALDQWRAALVREPEIVDVPAEHSTVLRGDSARVIGAWLKAEITRRRR
ncbi:amino acid adenylation domain-containing protein [Streptomyces canus]|uniref:non-ribosomal peptide synthetase n=1 Tax=Streptomyces canus TaxID=58343 RepID=UPI0036CD778B